MAVEPDRRPSPNDGHCLGGCTHAREDDPLIPLPYRKIVVYNAMVIGELVEVRVTLGGTAPWARVRIWACGRTH